MAAPPRQGSVSHCRRCLSHRVTGTTEHRCFCPGPQPSSDCRSNRFLGTRQTVGTEVAIVLFDGFDDLDLVVVPGGGWNARAATGVRAQVDSNSLPEALARRVRPGRRRRLPGMRDAPSCTLRNYLIGPWPPWNR